MDQGGENVKAVYTVPFEHFDLVKKKIEGINRRADKHGLEPFRLVVVDDNAKYPIYADPGHSVKLYDVRGVEFYIEGEVIRLPGGWTILAVKKHDPAMDRPLVTRTSDDELPKRFYAMGPECQHCQLSRIRTTTIVLKSEDGKLIQVGKSCLKDFLGHYPESAISYAMALSDVNGWLLSKLDEEAGPPRARDSGVEIVFFLSLAVYFVSRDGYVKSRATDDRGMPLASTADTIAEYLVDVSKGRTKQIEITPEHTQRARTVLAWAKEASKTQQGDYWWNVGAALSIDWVTMRTQGIVASLVAAYNRHLEKKAKAAASQKAGANEWVGTVGERLKGLKLNLVRKIVNDGMYGTTYILKFVDDAGHSFTWFSSSGTDAKGEIWGEGGEVYYGTGTVKKHDTFREEKQTILTRATLSKEPLVAKEKKPSKPRGPRKTQEERDDAAAADIISAASLKIDGKLLKAAPGVFTRLPRSFLQKKTEHFHRQFIATWSDDAYREEYAPVLAKIEQEIDRRSKDVALAKEGAKILSAGLHSPDFSEVRKALHESIKYALPLRVYEHLDVWERDMLRKKVYEFKPYVDRCGVIFDDLKEAVEEWDIIIDNVITGLVKNKKSKRSR